ncbi:threonine--tRNA ligase [Candidatus Uhrbacteria bacterium]|nr:threonine--tRNA ligase [Candidatus Uhrbacteria bacterium]
MTQDQQQKLQQIRHSLAHLTVAAAKSLWPGTCNAIGPAIDDGFYQDFDFGTHTISEKDFPKLEKRMREILKHWKPFKEWEVSVEEARKMFANNPYKLELIEDFATKGQKITVNDPGNFLDLCRGGHSDNPKEDMKHFKLLSTAGAYWRGDEKKKMLTRIYGTAFFTDEDLQKHLTMLEEAKKRDHRKLGVELDLFTFSDLVGPGLPLWTPRGTLIRNLLNDFVWELRRARGYERVTIPHITKKDLYEKSGHWDKFKNELFRITTREEHVFAMKPMNCPHHIQIFKRQPHSYREMPQRYTETTMVYRDEQTGELSGLSRVRCITQDDAHVFCRQSQIKDEFLKVWDIIDAFYKAVGFSVLDVRLSLHDPKHFEKYLGTPELWKEAEGSLRAIATERAKQFTEAPGEAAFYGPKVDFMAHDSIGRQWQVATIQLDINMPERFDLTCVNEKGENERIVMIHAAIMGSIERFVSVLIEHHAGAFPTWLAPVQVQVLPVSTKHDRSAKKLTKLLLEAGIRVHCDDANETVGYKIRKAEKQKVPYMLVIGDKEAKLTKLAVRLRGQQKTKDMMVKKFVERVTKEIEKRK